MSRDNIQRGNIQPSLSRIREYVYHYIQRFKAGRTSLDDVEHARRLNIEATDEDIPTFP